jgi:hypothetical protein
LQWELRDIFCSLTQQKVIFHWLIILDNILKNFTNTNDYLMILAKVAIVLVIILSFPMIHFCCRDSIEGFFFKIKFQTFFSMVGSFLGSDGFWKLLFCVPSVMFWQFSFQVSQLCLV